MDMDEAVVHAGRRPAPAEERDGDGAPGARLVVVDMQRAFADPGLGWGVQGYEQAQRRVEDLLQHFGSSSVLTRFVRDPAEQGAWRDYYGRWPQFRVPVESELWDLTVERPPGARVLDAPTFSKWGAALEGAVADAPLLLCGVATECCVLATAFGAADAGHRVEVVADACAGATDELHRAALEILQANHPLVSVVTTADVLARSHA